MCFFQSVVLDRKPFVSGIVFFFFRLSFHPLFFSVSRRLEIRNVTFKPAFTVNSVTWTDSQLNVLYTDLNRLRLRIRTDNLTVPTHRVLSTLDTIYYVSHNWPTSYWPSLDTQQIHVAVLHIFSCEQNLSILLELAMRPSNFISANTAIYMFSDLPHFLLENASLVINFLSLP